jgi:predicted DNA-binding protein (UPF0278 family)
MNYEEWIRLGERLQLSGEDLGRFVQQKEEEYIAREERAMRREDEKRMLEMEHAFQMKDREIELEQLRMQRQGKESIGKSLRPKLPKFDERLDDMDAYIERFERFAKGQDWDISTWATSLSSLLTGKGLEVYTSMPPEEANNYTALKIAVLKRYQLTEEGFRLQFRESKPEAGETVFQFVARLRRYFSRWIEMAGTDTSYESLFDILLREQFIASCATDVAMFLKERAPANISEATKLAEQFVEAHGGRINRSNNVLNSRKASIQESRSDGRSQDWRSDGRSQDWKSDGKFQNTRTGFQRGGEKRRNAENRKSCFICNRLGHFARDCRSGQAASQGLRNEKRIVAMCTHSEMKAGPVVDNTVKGCLKLQNGDSLPILSGGCTIEMLEGKRNLDIKKGLVSTHEVNVLRDTGCELAAVRRELVKDEQFLEKEIMMVTIDGEAKVVPTARISVDTPYYVGELEVMVPKALICDLIIGNVPGATIKPDPEWVRRQTKSAAAVMTRTQLAKSKQPLNALQVPAPSVTKEINSKELQSEQQKDATLEKLWTLSKNGDQKETKSGALCKYEEKQGVLYRIFKQKRGSEEHETKQVVVPLPLRRRVMELAHESIVGGHLSSKKTLDRISSSFHWPGIDGDTRRFCRSCDMCQRMIPKGRVTKVPLGTMPVMEEPFRRMAMDIIGPIAPKSDKGNRYILTMVDYATRYPEAVALPSVETERVAEAMLEVFSRVGFPNEILSDNGSQFTSRLMKEVSRLVSLKQLFTTPYNPKCNGLCERINGVLKSMLKKMCQERPKDWDRYLAAVLFAYREVPQASTGFSPFELLYGRAVRGPMQVLEDIWTGEETSEVHNTYQYVLDLKHRLEETCKIAAESVKNAGMTFKHHYDKKARRRYLDVGDRVLVLLPTDRNKMMLQWKGPFHVTGKINDVDYKVNMGNKVNKFHINLLKKYEERNDEILAGIAIVEAETHEDVGVVDDENLLDFPGVDGKENYKDVQVCDELTNEQKKQVRILLEQYKDIFTERPGTTTLEEHVVETKIEAPIRVGSYSMPYAKRVEINREVEEMLALDVIEEARSDYNSPIVMVKKKDGSNRFCVDFRKLNAVTKFNNEPMANVEDILAKLKDDKFFSKIDLAKGYWQIPVRKDCRHLTAFSTDKGSYQFKKMPFGMVNSGATFNRMMRKLLNDCENMDNYVDDILGHTQHWEAHIETLRQVFRKIREARLTIRPTKCFIGFFNIGFTGYTVGNGVLQMEEDKVQKIKEACVPRTKKQVRSFLGLASYYRKFIPMFAETAAALTDLTKKGRPHAVKWTAVEDKAFNTIKNQLTKEPILRLPDFSKEFVLQTDASDVGVGAALLQQYEDELFPVAFASKKLLPRERNYSVTERECLAIIFGIRHFQKYLYGKEFVIQTDHSALTYIQRCKLENGRLMRWALFLQSYRFRMEAIKGSANRVADYLSRMWCQDENKGCSNTTDVEHRTYNASDKTPVGPDDSKKGQDDEARLWCSSETEQRGTETIQTE